MMDRCHLQRQTVWVFLLALLGATAQAASGGTAGGEQPGKPDQTAGLHGEARVKRTAGEQQPNQSAESQLFENKVCDPAHCGPSPPVSPFRQCLQTTPQTACVVVDGEQSPVSIIVQLRRRFGNPFEGTQLQDESVEERSFAEALRRAARQAAPTTADRSQPGSIANDPASWARFFIEHSPTESIPQPALCGSSPSSLPPSGPHVTRMRRVARALDQLAADLEELECYAQADELRDIAHRLRQTARGSDHSANQQAQEAAASALRSALRKE